MEMFCRQCEQTAKGEGCTIKGVCGKTAEAAVLQDLLIYNLKGIAVYTKLARELGIKSKEADLVIIKGLFTTVTNVNFDSKRLEQIIRNSFRVKEKVKKLFLDAYRDKNGSDFSGNFPQPTEWAPADSLEGLIEQGEKAGIKAGSHLEQDIRSLREILLYGLKGMAAYADHAYILGEEDEEVFSFFSIGLASLIDENLGSNDLIDLIMEFGQVNLRCLEILDKAHTNHFGKPVPTRVFSGIKKGPAIIVSGHDLYDLEQLLEQTKGSGINIYTHGEMLPSHSYPWLKKYDHLVGHFGTAWQNQQKEFDSVPAAILMTTNCIQQPRPSYTDRIFTTGLVAWPGLQHIAVNKEDNRKDFSKIIAKAKELEGFGEDTCGKEILTGFAHQAVLSLADKIVDAVKTKAVRRFFLIGGCDGSKPGRNYYTEFAKSVPEDCIILTLACGKFRFNNLDFGYIGDFPRLLDCGQCNDAYSAIKIALSLAKAFNCGVNDLPLSLILSWYEQKAVCILLTLLSLGVKNIYLGPSLPAFISKGVLGVLVEKFNIKPISTAKKDLEAILNKA